MIIIPCCQYYDNRDSSKASMKCFNDLPSGRYPSFTFCAHPKEGKLFNNEILLQQFGLSKEEKYQILIGKRNATNLQLNKIKFDKLVSGIDEFMEIFEAEDNSYLTYNEWNPSMTNSMGSPLHQTYRDPTSNCFTYDTIYDQSLSLNSIKIKFNIRLFDLS